MTGGVPLADPLRLGQPESRAVRQALDEVMSSGPLILGPWVERFEDDFAAYLVPEGPRPIVVGVGNGSDALTIALACLDLPDTARVLVPANDGGFAAAAVRASGLTPVAVDADDVTQLIDVPALDAAPTDGVRAVVATHLHGQPADLTAIKAWCAARGLLLVEDAAQAHGATSRGRRVGALADAAAFSFYPTKNLGALGDAGAAVFTDPAAAARARRLRQYGWGDHFRIEVAGGRNTRMDALQAAVLSARLPFLDDNNARRRTIVGRYRAALAGSDAVVLGDATGSVAHHAVVLHPDRDGLVDVLGRHGVATSVHYPWLVTEMPGLGMATTATPRADLGRRCKVSLPCFPTLTSAEVDRVVEVLDEWVRLRG
jgi:dTDP-4-amino-4,6-dideoxygalactose transaminase